MVTYFRDPSVVVTSAAIRVDDRAYPLRELSRVWHQRGQKSWRAVARRAGLGAMLLVPLGLAVLVLAVALTLHASATVTVALVGGAVLVGLAFGPVADVVLEHMDRSYARGAQANEIWAWHRGAPVLLVRTGDAQRFGQIYRALQRAMEAAPTQKTRRAPAQPA